MTPPAKNSVCPCDNSADERLRVSVCLYPYCKQNPVVGAAREREWEAQAESHAEYTLRVRMSRAQFEAGERTWAEFADELFGQSGRHMEEYQAAREGFQAVLLEIAEERGEWVPQSLMRPWGE